MTARKIGCKNLSACAGCESGEKAIRFQRRHVDFLELSVRCGGRKVRELTGERRIIEAIEEEEKT